MLSVHSRIRVLTRFFTILQINFTEWITRFVFTIKFFLPSFDEEKLKSKGILARYWLRFILVSFVSLFVTRESRTN